MASENCEKPKQFHVGDHVFAIVRGYPLWPAKIESLPDPNSKKPLYDITFYGANEPGRLKFEELLLYAENQDKFDKSSKFRYYQEGMKELRKDFMAKLQLSNAFCDGCN